MRFCSIARGTMRRPQINAKINEILIEADFSTNTHES
jgi:hypothetical protein